MIDSNQRLLLFSFPFFLLLLNHIEFFCLYCISNKTDAETLLSCESHDLK